MSPDGSKTKFKKEMAKQPLMLMTRSESGAHTGIEDIHCVIPKRIRLPIPPPIATKKYLLIKTIRYSAHLQYPEITLLLKVTIGPDPFQALLQRLRRRQTATTAKTVKQPPIVCKKQCQGHSFIRSTTSLIASSTIVTHGQRGDRRLQRMQARTLSP